MEKFIGDMLMENDIIKELVKKVYDPSEAINVKFVVFGI
jgi:hypothetical protein